MKNTTKQILIGALLASSTFAFNAAHAQGMFEPMGMGSLYGGAAVGQAETNCGKSGKCDSSAWKLFGGYQFNDMFGLEGNYTNFGEDVTGLGLAGVAAMPVGEQLEVFGKAGVMKWTDESVSGTERSDSDMLLGIGASYIMDDNWGIRGEYETVDGDIDASMYSIGATFSTL